MKQTGGIGSAEPTIEPTLQFILVSILIEFETFIQRHATNRLHAVEITPRLIRSDFV